MQMLRLVCRKFYKKSGQFVVECALPCPALPFLALSCLVLPCPALPCPALPCLSLPCLVLSCQALPAVLLLTYRVVFVYFSSKDPFTCISESSRHPFIHNPDMAKMLLFFSSFGHLHQIPKFQEDGTKHYITFYLIHFVC